MQIDIDLLQFRQHLRFQQKNGQRYLHDPIRRQWLVLTPEELVRQTLVQFLIRQRSYPAGRLSIERTLQVNGRERRYDLLAFDADMQPFLLVECKAPEVAINQKVFEQIARYNLGLQVPNLLITNGLHSYCCSINFVQSSFEFLNSVPEYPGPHLH